MILGEGLYMCMFKNVQTDVLCSNRNPKKSCKGHIKGKQMSKGNSGPSRLNCSFFNNDFGQLHFLFMYLFRDLYSFGSLQSGTLVSTTFTLEKVQLYLQMRINHVL